MTSRGVLCFAREGGAVKQVAEYRRRALAVQTLADGALCSEEANLLRRIGQEWLRAAKIREDYLKLNPDHANQRS